ncbi:Protein NEOXANTHIN-deficient 1 [Vitis vinifera]|uniref:Protein NEOXANTHIN-deficient 1 n=1 Tax=Vitis vinifera TaxID=29760 RepID=A0A438D177_VITVI|nr:Protein NEOXANTHIN-deficient 1 [Vitis vinifera]
MNSAVNLLLSSSQNTNFVSKALFHNLISSALFEAGGSRGKIFLGLWQTSMDIQRPASALKLLLHLVKAETARAFIPKEFRLVEAFGYTLGGFFLASYEDSPAGVFDELVVIAGIVWNPPTSCAWAARVLVNSDEACVHGRKAGSCRIARLPSQVARFSKRITAIPRQQRSKTNGFLNMIGIGNTFNSPKDCMDVQVTEIEGRTAADACSVNLNTAGELFKPIPWNIDVPLLKPEKWMGPAIKMSLPSFSGHTVYNPNLLKYSCQIECRVRAVKPARVSSPSPGPKNEKEGSPRDQIFSSMDSTAVETIENGENLCVSVMLSKPVLALEFNCLNMQVEAPIVVSHCSKNTLGGS